MCKNAKCPACKGRVIVRGVVCPVCEGRGFVVVDAARIKIKETEDERGNRVLR